MNEKDYIQTFNWLLLELQRRNAVDLVNEIESVIRTGITREREISEKRGRATFREPLSPRERLISSLRVILAAASVPLMLRDAASQMKSDSSSFIWAPDFIEDEVSVEDEARLQHRESSFRFELPKQEDLGELARCAQKVLLMLAEIEK